MATPDELDLADTDELIAALQRRSQASLIVLQVKKKTGEDGLTNVSYDGGLNTALGLAERAKVRLLADNP